MKTKEKQDKNFFPWMPYIFGIIFLITVAGIFFLFLNKEVEAIDEQSLVNPQEVIGPVRDFLEEIKKGHPKEAYNLTSSDFKIATSLQGFDGFIQSYDVFKEWDSVTFNDPIFEKNVSSVVAYLHFQDTEEEALPISFTLIREEKKWKIYGFILNNSQEEMSLKDLNALKDLIHAINLDLSYLKKGNLMAAYTKLYSKNYQRNKSYESFESNIRENSIFSRQDGASFIDGKLNGKEGTLRIALYEEDEAIPMDFFLVKEEGSWKIDKMDILLPSSLQKPLDKKEVGELMQEIHNFLGNLHQDSLEKAYNLFTSEGFKNSTSLAIFENFIKDHPVLMEKNVPQYLDGGKENNQKIIYLLYGKTPYQSAFELRFIEEPDGWKIKSIAIEEPQEETYAKPLDKDEALGLVEAALSILHFEQYERFYRYYTADGFKESTSYLEMIDFIDQHPVLKELPKVTIHEIVLDRDQLYIECELISPDHYYAALFTYQFVKGKWKILKIEVKAEEDRSASNTASLVKLSQILMGQKIDDLGMIQETDEPLNRDDPLYVTLFLTSHSADAEIALSLSHEESRTETLPIRGKVDNEGNNILTFSFLPPLDGWPLGNYLVTASSSLGDQILTHSFKIE